MPGSSAWPLASDGAAWAQTPATWARPSARHSRRRSARQRVLHHIDVAGVEAGLAIGQVELPDADEALVKAQGQHALALGQEVGAPAAAGFGVVAAKGHLVHPLEAGGLCLVAHFAGAGQAAARKDVLLDEVGRADVAVKQSVLNDDALDAGAATGFEQAGHALEIGGPVLLADGFEHFNRADGVIRAVVYVAVVLQAQVGLFGQALLGQALLR